MATLRGVYYTVNYIQCINRASNASGDESLCTIINNNRILNLIKRYYTYTYWIGGTDETILPIIPSLIQLNTN